MIDKKEFKKALTGLGVEIDDSHLTRLFELFDPDGSGTIDYDELNHLLRAGSAVKLQEELLAGGAR